MCSCTDVMFTGARVEWEDRTRKGSTTSQDGRWAVAWGKSMTSDVHYIRVNKEAEPFRHLSPFSSHPISVTTFLPPPHPSVYPLLRFLLSTDPSFPFLFWHCFRCVTHSLLMPVTASFSCHPDPRVSLVFAARRQVSAVNAFPAAHGSS